MTEKTEYKEIVIHYSNSTEGVFQHSDALWSLFKSFSEGEKETFTMENIILFRRHIRAIERK